MEPYADVVESYASFAREASDSPCFVEWSNGVAADPEIQELIATLPPVKQQPNLVYAAARWHGAPAPGPYAGLREVLLTSWDAVRGTILARSTQTNEVGRLATLLPALAQCSPLDGGPLALLEVGASAGLNLFPDHYRYVWRHEDGTSYSLGEGPELSCDITGDVPLPAAVPAIGWRGGVDLNPLDVTDEDAMAWLTNLVWPEQDDRRDRLAAAIEVAAADPPLLVAGDLVDTLPDLLDQLPGDVSPVVFHSAVIAYLEPARREDFHDLMTGLVGAGRCHWVSNEGPNVLPRISRSMPESRQRSTRFVLGVDGHAVALTHGHGRTMEWL